jgi:hypothetical protein
MRASKTSCIKDATRMMERHAQRERERERDGDRMVVVGGRGGFHDKCNSQAAQNETLRDQGLGFKED